MVRFSIFIILSLACFSCSTPHISMRSLEQCSFPKLSINDTLNLGYFDNLLDNTNNKRAARWAKRNHFHLFGIQLINNTDKCIHGSELEFYSEYRKLEVVSNKWAANKLRQRINSTPFIGFFTSLIEMVIYSKIDQESNNDINSPNDSTTIDHTLSNEIVTISEDIRKTANNNLMDEMIKYDIIRQKLYSDKVNYAIIVIKSDKTPQKIRVRITAPKEFKIGKNKLAPK